MQRLLNSDPNNCKYNTTIFYPLKQVFENSTFILGKQIVYFFFKSWN